MSCNAVVRFVSWSCNKGKMVADKAYNVQYPDESMGSWVSKEEAMKILDKSSSAFDTYVHRRKQANRPIDNAHKRQQMNDPRRLYFVTAEEQAQYNVQQQEIASTSKLTEAIGKVLKEQQPQMQANVRKKDDSANIKLENLYKEQIADLKERNAKLEKENNSLKTEYLKASENVSDKLVKLTRGLLEEKAVAIANLNKEIQILSMKAGQVEVLEGLNKQLIEREDELRKLLPALIQRLNR